MRCASCGGNMEFRKEEYGFSCPFCGAFEKLDQDLSEEEIQKLIDDSISQHRKYPHHRCRGVGSDFRRIRLLYRVAIALTPACNLHGFLVVWPQSSLSTTTTQVKYP